MSDPRDSKDAAILEKFHTIVNMTPAALEKHLATDESQLAGWAHGSDADSVGHHSGQRVVEIKRKQKAGLPGTITRICVR